MSRCLLAGVFIAQVIIIVQVESSVSFIIIFRVCIGAVGINIEITSFGTDYQYEIYYIYFLFSFYDCFLIFMCFDVGGFK